jgi:hypothetical protein
MIRFQPSTNTKSINLKGSEMSACGSIIMPMETSKEEITRSRIKKGRYRRKPI